MVPTNFLPILVSKLSQQTTPSIPLQSWALPPLHWLSCRSTGLQLLHFPFFGFFFFMCFLRFFFLFVLFPLHVFPTTFDFLLFLRFLPLWLCLVSSCVSCHCGLSCFFACILPLWVCTVLVCFTSVKLEFILIPLYKGIMGFLPLLG